jgi:hypothetical protein
LTRAQPLALHASHGADGKGGLLREADDDRLVLVAEVPVAAPVGPENRGDLAFPVKNGRADHGLCFFRSSPVVQDRGVGEARIGEVVVGAHRAPLREDQPGHALAGDEANARELGGARAVRHHRLRVQIRRLRQRAEGAVGTQQLARLAHHRAQRGLQVRRRQRLGRHALERLDLGEPLEGLGVEPRVPHRGGGGGGHRGGQLDLLG